ncbi:MAG: hypothetical protein IJ833_09500 [Lachnospiraceae bacterium]|nr:hypothetical protein [Lachnospiraceae bacterium]
MRIVSQDRKLSVDFDRCEIWMQGNTIYRRIGNDNQLLGVYESPERAVEVLRTSIRPMHRCIAYLVISARKRSEKCL